MRFVDLSYQSKNNQTEFRLHSRLKILTQNQHEYKKYNLKLPTHIHRFFDD